MEPVKSVTVIGIGSLGSYIVDAIVNLENIEEIVLVDHDLVELKNLKNSVYRPIDIGEHKVTALKEIIEEKNSTIKVYPCIGKYSEELSCVLNKTDIVIDCRDIITNRSGKIDARFYISGRYLVGDFRKIVKYKYDRNGRYINEVDKNDLMFAGITVSNLIHNGVIIKLINKQLIKHYELDYTKHIEEIDNHDIILEENVVSDKLLNFKQKIVSILNANKKYPISLFINGNDIDMVEIPKYKLKETDDIVNEINALVERYSYDHYIVKLQQQNNYYNLELIPETGAA